MQIKHKCSIIILVRLSANSLLLLFFKNICMLSTGNERGPASENDYISDDRAPSGVQASAAAVVHDCSNQQDVRIECPQACITSTSGLSISIYMSYDIVHVCMYVFLTLLQDYYYYKLYEWGVFVPTAVSFSSYCVLSLLHMYTTYNVTPLSLPWQE